MMADPYLFCHKIFNKDLQYLENKVKLLKWSIPSLEIHVCTLHIIYTEPIEVLYPKI